MRCPQCQAEVADGSQFCPACGRVLANVAPPSGQIGYATPPPPSVQPLTASGLAAPYGVDPVSGKPYSDKSKIVAGLLQILIPFGIGRFYIGHTGMGVAQLLVTVFTCGLGSLWSLVDGIIILASNVEDASGRPLRPS